MLELNWNLLWTVVNLIVLTLLLWKFLFKPVRKVMAEREELIKSQLDEAQKKNEEADAKLEDAAAVVKDAQNKATKEADILLADAKTKNDMLLAQAQSEAEKIVEESRVKAEKERDKMLADAKDDMVSISIEAAKNVAKANISEEEEHKLFGEMLQKVGAYNEQ